MMIDIRMNDRPDGYGFVYGQASCGDATVRVNLMPPAHLWAGDIMMDAPEYQPHPELWKVFLDGEFVAGMARREDLETVINNWWNLDMAHDDDGVALQNVAHPIEITGAMLEAGEKVFVAAWPRPVYPTLEWTYSVVAAIYTAMVRAAPVHGDGDLNEAALEQALIEINRHKDVIESFAKRAALGNNGGDWSEHYTESQKEHWRQFVRDLIEEVARIHYDGI